MSDSWPRVPLGKVLTRSEEWIDIRPDEQYRLVTVRLWGGGVTLRNEVSGDRIAAKRQLVVRPDQFILSRIDARNGAFGLIPDSSDGAIVSNDFPVFNIDGTKAIPRFLEWMSKTRPFVDLCRAASEGTTNRVRLKVDRFLATPVSLPPLPKQRRIVARIEELAALIEEARALRVRAQEETETLLNGKLASVYAMLIERNGAHQLGDLILSGGYGTSTKCTYEPLEGAVPVLRIPNVASEQVNFDDIKYGVLSEADLERVLVAVGDILAVRTCGSADLVGRCAVVPPLSEPTAFASYLIRLRCDLEIISPNYLQLMLKHLRTDGQLFDLARTTAGQYNVSLGRLRAVKIPVPPLPEQHRIVAYLDGLQAQVDKLTALQQATQAELDALLPAVLAQAFQGEL